MDLLSHFIIGCVVLAACALFVGFVLDTIDKRRLLRARKALDEKLTELNAVEDAIRLYTPHPLADDILAYVNTLDAKNLEQLLVKLSLDKCNELADAFAKFLERDALKKCWVYSYDVTGIEALQDDNRAQYAIWMGRRTRLRRESSLLQVAFDELESQPHSKKAPSKDAASPNPEDKRAKLKKLRVDITGKRLEEERLEKEILDDEQGEPIPNRRPEGVSTDD